MTDKIQAADLVLKVIEDWGVPRIYGMPGGSFDSMMSAIHNERANIDFVQVRHEEGGALAASAEAKLTGRIGVCFGSSGPGAIHLLNGLYDAREDGVPVLALVGQVPEENMNIDYFQAMDEGPIFEDVAVFNRVATTAKGLPKLIDEAIRQAYKHRGVSVVIIPKDLGWELVDNVVPSSAAAFRDFQPTYPLPDAAKVEEAVRLLEGAKAPLLYFGLGARTARDELVALSDKLKLPIISTYISKGVVEDAHPAYLGSTWRVATKPAYEAGYKADVVLWVGNDIPFGDRVLDPNAKVIQIDIDSAKIGKRRKVDVGFVADAKTTLKAILDESHELEPTPYYKAALANKRNWEEWIASFHHDERTPVRPEPIFHAIEQAAGDTDVFLVDVGNVNINFERLIRLVPTQKWVTSGKHATMGFAVPASAAAALEYPDRTVWTLSGDGGFAMMVEELLVQVKYRLPVINVVFSNETLGFIEAEQRDDTHQPLSGVDLIDTNWERAAEAFGAVGFTAHTREDFERAVAEAKRAGRPAVIDVKLTHDMPFTTIHMHLDAEDPERDEFVAKYEAEALKTFDELLAEVSAPASVLANDAAAEQSVEQESLHEQRQDAPVAG